jgi:cytochrome P450
MSRGDRSPAARVDGPAPAAADENAVREAALAFDLRRLDRSFLDDPYPVYRALREHDPVHRMGDGSYFLTRYDDLVAVYHDAQTWRSDKKIDFKPKFADSLLYEHHTTSLVFNDPPAHTRVRKLLAPTFAPRALKALQPRIEALVDKLIDRAAERGTIDIIDDFAAAIPVQLIGDLLGIPGDERAPLRGWSLAILGALEPVLSEQQFAAGVTAVAEFKTYLTDLVARRKREPSRDEGEILSTLVAASALADNDDEGAGERLSELELLHNCIFLLNAGHETTTNLIGNSVDLLIRHPDGRRALGRAPQLIGSAVEEFLRMESSNQLGNRRAACDTEIGGVRIPAGTYVHLGIGAANRDVAQFPDPDRLDIARNPNRHLAFGGGIHACAGLSLARMEAQVAIGKLVQRFTSIERSGEAVRGGRARFRGFLHYPVALR